MKRWSLFVDESGSFKGANGSLVAGILVPASAKHIDSANLRKQFAKIWGPAPFPPHAAIYADWMGQALLAAIPERPHHMPPGDYASARREASRLVLSVLERSSFAWRLEQLRESAHPILTHQDLNAARAAISPLMPDEALDEVATKQRVAMNLLVQKTLHRYPGTRVFLAQSVQEPRPDVIPGTRLFRDRYLDALEVLLGRLHRVLGDGDHCELYVLTRDVQTTGLTDKPVMLDFGGLLLRELVEAVRTEVGGLAACRPANAVQRYRDRPEIHDFLHPFLVLADWVATSCRSALTDKTRTLSMLEDDLYWHLLPQTSLRARTQLPQSEALPLVGATGRAEAKIQAALRGARVLPPDPQGPLWLQEQCAEWVAAAGGLQ
jgi:hypothetical protein